MTLACAVAPSAAVAVTVTVHSPGPYVALAVGPSAVAPFPSCQWYEAASPCASNVTVSGAAPAVAVAEIVTLGAPAFAGAAPASTARTTTPTTRRTHRLYPLVRLASTLECSAFAEPSSGLEPETPPYHALASATGRNPRQRGFGLFRPLRHSVDLRLIATGCDHGAP